MLFVLEATSRFELENNGFADRGLTTWLCRRIRNTDIISRQSDFVKGFIKVFRRKIVFVGEAAEEK